MRFAVAAVVLCQSLAANLLDVGSESGYVRFDPSGAPYDFTELERPVCQALERFAHDARTPGYSCVLEDAACPERSLEDALAVDTLAHEAWHLRGIASEPQYRLPGLRERRAVRPAAGRSGPALRLRPAACFHVAGAMAARDLSGARERSSGTWDVPLPFPCPPERSPSVRESERVWVRDAQRGSAVALEALFRAHWPRAYRAALLVVGDAAAAEDIAQESFLAAVRALDRFDRRRPFGPWLHRIVVNRSIDWGRARALRREFDLDRASEPAAPNAPHRERADEISEALADLAPEQRAVIVLRYLLDYTPGEIADLLDLPRGTVNSRLRRGLDRLAEALE
jgi:RNA polymerase sigma-70 factor (ECF subfamily)